MPPSKAPWLSDSFVGMQAGVVKSVSGKETEEEKEDEMNIQVAVKDQGMMLISAVAPDFHWQGGSADIDFRYGYCLF